MITAKHCFLEYNSIIAYNSNVVSIVSILNIMNCDSLSLQSENRNIHNNELLSLIINPEINRLTQSCNIQNIQYFLNIC